MNAVASGSSATRYDSESVPRLAFDIRIASAVSCAGVAIIGCRSLIGFAASIGRSSTTVGSSRSPDSVKLVGSSRMKFCLFDVSVCGCASSVGA